MVAAYAGGPGPEGPFGPRVGIQLRHDRRVSKAEAGNFSVQPVRDAGELRRFLDVSYSVHRDEPRWVPALRSELLARLRFRRNPFWKRADGRLLLARRGGDAVGRISVHLDASVGADRSVAMWGWFECADDDDAARALFEAAAAWAADAGARSLLGPASFTAVEEAGLLVEGHDAPASFLAPWHPPRYAGLVEGSGLRPIDADLQTLRVDLSGRDSPAVAGGSAPRIRTVVAGADPGDAGALVARHPAAWAPTSAEVRARLRRLRPLMDRDLAVGPEGGSLALAVRDLGEILERLKDRLGPKGVAGVLAEARRASRGAVLVFLGGSPAALPGLVASAAGAGYERLEATVAATATEVRTAFDGLGAQPIRRYRMFERPL